MEISKFTDRDSIFKNRISTFSDLYLLVRNIGKWQMACSSTLLLKPAGLDAPIFFQTFFSNIFSLKYVLNKLTLRYAQIYIGTRADELGIIPKYSTLKSGISNNNWYEFYGNVHG
jgi:hypothetical protein